MRIIRKLRGIAAFFAAGALAAAPVACASGTGRAGDEATTPTPRVTTIQVENEEDFTMRIEVNTDVDDAILGQVTPFSTETFRMPAGFSYQGRDVWLEAHPIGSTAVYRSGRIYPHPGDRIAWELRGGPAQSASTITVDSPGG